MNMYSVKFVVIKLLQNAEKNNNMGIYFILFIFLK